MKRIGRTGLFVAAVLLVGTSTGHAQGPAPTLSQAITRINAQEFDAGIVLLQELLASDSTNGRAWLWLGIANRGKEDLEAALSAFSRAAHYTPTVAQGLYQAGTTFARLGNADSAFVWLERAAATGRIDVTAIDNDANAQSLRHDPRYAGLFPTAEDFANPFVESTRILAEWRGEAPNDQFGWIARNVGDVDGDGIADAVTSAPTNAENGTGAGKVYVYSSKTGELLWSRVGRENDNLGIGLEAAGDVNADGVIDVVASAPPANRVDVYSGVDGQLLLTVTGDSATDNFGSGVAALGDVNGDGHDDFLVGAPQNDKKGADAGAAYVISGQGGERLHTIYGESEGDNFGSAVDGRLHGRDMVLVVGAGAAGPRSNGAVYVYRELGDTPAFVIANDSLGTSLGAMFVSVVGDVDRDGIEDVFASDWSHGALGPSTGRVYLHSGATGERINALTGENAGDGFGIGRSEAGDADGDGHADLVIGAWQFRAAAASGGKVYVYSGKTGRLLQEITGRVMGETLGFDTAGMGDVDGDGIGDYLLTSAWSAVTGTRSGRMFIVAGTR